MTDTLQPYAELAREIYVGMWSGDIWKEAGQEPTLRLMLEKTLEPRIEELAQRIADKYALTGTEDFAGKEIAKLLREYLGGTK